MGRFMNLNTILLFFVLILVFPLVSSEGCLEKRPMYKDSMGIIHNSFCYGPDGVAGNEDDCGCPIGFECENDGRCIGKCADGTIVGKCSEQKPWREVTRAQAPGPAPAIRAVYCA